MEWKSLFRENERRSFVAKETGYVRKMGEAIEMKTNLNGPTNYGMSIVTLNSRLGLDGKEKKCTPVVGKIEECVVPVCRYAHVANQRRYRTHIP